jgi:hypothetical protein
LDGLRACSGSEHKLAMRWYCPYDVLEVFAGGGTMSLRLPEELGRISTVVNISRLKFSELRDAELSTSLWCFYFLFLQEQIKGIIT